MSGARCTPVAAAALLGAVLVLTASPAPGAQDWGDRVRDWLGLAERGEFGDDDDDDGAPPRPIEYLEAAPVLELAPDRQALAGIEAVTAAAVRLSAEDRALGIVVDLQPLTRLRARYRAARAEREVAAAGLAPARAERDRLQVLYREDGNVSARRLQEAEAALVAAQARHGAAAGRLEDVRLEAAQGWGGELAALALEDGGAQIEGLLRGEQVLVLVALDPAVRAVEAPARVYIERGGERARAREAQRVAAAPSSGALAQAETWFYRTDAAPLRTGMRVDVWVPAGAEIEAVRVPEPAVVWHGGRPWVYVQLDARRFVRRALAEYRRAGAQWLVLRGPQAGDRIVVAGAQVLLSEEFRWNIPEEDDVD